METSSNPYKIKKTFGLSVLLKLTRQNIKDIKIMEDNGSYTSNLDLAELSRAVDRTIQTHNIRLKFG